MRNQNLVNQHVFVGAVVHQARLQGFEVTVSPYNPHDILANFEENCILFEFKKGDYEGGMNISIDTLDDEKNMFVEAANAFGVFVSGFEKYAQEPVSQNDNNEAPQNDNNEAPQEPAAANEKEELTDAEKQTEKRKAAAAKAAKTRRKNKEKKRREEKKKENAAKKSSKKEDNTAQSTEQDDDILD